MANVELNLFLETKAALQGICRQSSQVCWYKCVLDYVCVMFTASQAPGAHWDLPHWVGSAPLTSLSSLDKDGRNLPLCFCLPWLSPLSISAPLPLSHSCIIFPLLLSFATFLPAPLFLFLSTLLISYLVLSHPHLS